VTHQLVAQQEQVQGAVATIVHLDEVLTMSARMAAATGDLAWESRYRMFEPKLDAAIQEARRLAGDRFGEAYAAQTDAANLKLVEMENRAFELVRGGRPEEARATLFSPAYEDQKRIYADGMAQLTTVLAQQTSATLASERQRVLWSVASVVGVAPLLLVTWLVVLVTLRNWQGQLMEQNRQLTQQTEELGSLNQTLGQKVLERTQELTDANATLEAKLRELELLNKVTMGREERILELKEEVRSLQAQLKIRQGPPSS
jgi:DNA repair exonuclease SbcCD ATPase subunit